MRNTVPFRLIEQRTDTNGRYVFLHGLLNGTPVVLGCIYAPNTEQDKYLHTLNTILSDWSQYPWLIGGDFNAVLDLN